MRSSPTNCALPALSFLYTRTTPFGIGMPRRDDSRFSNCTNTPTFIFCPMPPTLER